MTTCENYGVYSHEQIYHEMYDGAGPSSQADAVAGWRELAARLTRIRHYLDSAVSGVQESQQGAAADAAVGAMVPLGSWLDEAQRLANDTRDRIDHQVSEFTLARNSIPEVPPAPRGWGWQDIPVIDSFTTSDQEADEAFNAEQERQARAVMMAYQTSTNERVVSVAEFAPPPTGEPDLTVPTANRSAVGGIPGGGGVLGVGPGGPVSGASTSLAGTGGATPAELPGPVPAPTGPQGGPGPASPGPRPAPVAPVPPPVASVGIPPVGVAPGTPAAARPRTPGAGRAGVGRGGPGGGPAVPRGGPGSGGVGAPGGRGLGGFGPDRGAGGFGPGGGPSGSPESAARAGGTAGTASPGGGRGAGAAGTGMVPFGGAGRGGEDRERQRPSYLVESDPNRLIGELPPTAPPVIGEDPPAPDEHGRR